VKKIRIVQVVGIVLFLSYLLLFVVNVFRGLFADFYQILLSVIMTLIGFNLVFKGVVIKSNSTLWFANVLITMSLTIIILNLLKIDMDEILYLFTIIPIFASVLNLVVFNNLIYLKIIIINITFIVPALIQKFYKFELYCTIGMYVISILIGILVCRLINLDKENV
jgi:hypothetical protein